MGTGGQEEATLTVWRWVLAIGSALVVAAAAATTAWVHHSAQTRAQRAVAAAQTLLRVYYSPNFGLLADTPGAATTADAGNLFPTGPMRPTAMWGYSWALDALQEAERLPGGGVLAQPVQLLNQHLQEYWVAGASPPAYAPYPFQGPSTLKYHDDNAWAGLDLERAWRQTGNAADLRQAEAVFRYLQSGWDPNGGGIYWNDNPQGRNTAATAPSAELASRLYLDTHQVDDLVWAKKIYAWEVANLVDPSTGAVWDTLQADGTISKNQYTYNEGTVIGAAALLYRITGARPYLVQAERTFNDVLNTLVHTVHGQPDILVPQPFFNGVLADDLVLLYRVDPDPRIVRLLDANAQAAWRRARDPRTGLIGSNWAGPPPQDPATQAILVQTGAVRVLAADARVHTLGMTLKRWLHPGPRVPVPVCRPTSLYQGAAQNCGS